MKITFIVSGNIRSNFSYRPLALARSLAARGHQVRVIAPKADKYNNFRPECVSDIDGVRILQPFQFATRVPEINLLPYLFGASRLLLKERSDLVYIYKVTPISVVGLLAKFLHGTQTVVDFDDLGSEVMKIEGHPFYQRALVQWSERLAAHYCDRMVVASRYLLDLYQDIFPHKQIHLMPNGVENTWFASVSESSHPHRIVFMGSINRTNILEPLFEVLPEVVKRYPDLELLVMGDGHYLRYFKERAEVLGIEKHCTFTGWLSLEDAQSNLHAGDIGYSCMPEGRTNRAASNMKVPQYMARGVVPLVSDTGDLPATVDYGKAGYICKADDAESLQATLLEALGDTKRAEKSVHTRVFALQQFSWDTLTQEFQNWLQPTPSKKLYFVSVQVPGNVGGAEIRNYNLLRQLISKVQAQVEVFCIATPGRVEREGRELQASVPAPAHIVAGKSGSWLRALWSIGVSHVPPYLEDARASGIGRIFRQACEVSLPDTVHIAQLHAYYCIRPHIPWLKSKGVKIIFDCQNIESKLFAEVLELFPFYKKAVGKFLVPYIQALEIEATKYADAVLVCSNQDAAFFKAYNARTYVVPNGVDSSQFTPHPESQTPALIFMGGVGYPPNGDGLAWYLRDIHPKVQAKVPAVTLLAIGADKGWLRSQGIADTSIMPLGFVDDVRPYLTQATLGICPIRYGSGTRIKIMTYMAAGLPVVSTAIGAEGADYTPGENILVDDEPHAFADAVVKLLYDQNYRHGLATRGRDFILQNYDWNVIGKRLLPIYQHGT